MRFHGPIRTALAVTLGLFLAGTPAYARWRQGGAKALPPRVLRQTPPPPNGRGPANVPRQQQRQQQRIQNQGHLADWMQKHSNMSLPDQQRAMQAEPGFRELPQWEQQQQLNQLGRLYAMNPQQRARQLSRVEALERLNPGQRQQYAAAAQQLYGLPGPRKSMVARAMLDLREMPPEQREQIIGSPAFAQQFPDPSDRTMIRTLLTAEPYPPAPAR